MPTYGPKIIGEIEFKLAMNREQKTGGNVYGERTQSGALVAAPNPVVAEAAEAVAQLRDVTDQEAALRRLETVIGEGYTVTDAEVLLSQTTDFWRDLALAELYRGQTAGVRKGIVKLLSEQGGAQQDEGGRALLLRLTGAVTPVG